MTRALLVDLEGTICPVDFVYKTLKDYSIQQMSAYLTDRAAKNALPHALKALADAADIEPGNLAALADQLVHWIQQDEKSAQLKMLQCQVWAEGFIKGDLSFPVFEDSASHLRQWKLVGVRSYLLSTAPVMAQKLMLEHSRYGDLQDVVSGHFDTHIGCKVETNTYQQVANKLKLKPSEILFISDSAEELDAAAETGMQTCHLVRDGQEADSGHKIVNDFYEITPEYL
ncbi:acireductone synthase [Pelagibaculum spongiae]|uniref:Acireductone synthase n=1 Tax=Pelagibaculum spongiae TaxID=2080658 RepID=A0A2V1GNC6_9GAMM|nr:acireductone synthase [Pelagibaculum spongiae]PVZ63431.1 acireductone synthase [Pelagibaculum spongiae]